MTELYEVRREDLITWFGERDFKRRDYLQASFSLGHHEVVASLTEHHHEVMRH
jgi:hypothetical protein